MLSIIKKIFKTKNERDILELKKILYNVKNQYKIIKNFTNDELRISTIKLREKIKSDLLIFDKNIQKIKKLILYNHKNLK
ncbi:MAG: hypothetical protein IR527_02145, partial [Bacteroides sp.]